MPKTKSRFGCITGYVRLVASLSLSQGVGRKLGFNYDADYARSLIMSRAFVDSLWEISLYYTRI